MMIQDFQPVNQKFGKNVSESDSNMIITIDSDIH
jgi:hypothetical protein